MILGLVLICGQAALAGVVTPDQARKLAGDFFSAKRAGGENLRLVWSSPDTGTRSDADAAPALYVYERAGGGYAVIAGDDAVTPVLGYSLSGSFPAGDMPENMRDLFDWYTGIIHHAREQGWTVSRTKAPEQGGRVVLQTAHWSQRSPFNDLVPMVSGEKPPLGCGATAVSIIMRYHKWPQKGSGTLPGYEYEAVKDGKKVVIDPVPLGHTYNWDLMPERASDFTSEEASQIARLCYDVAVMMQMYFNPGASGSVAEDAGWLAKYFGYDKRMRRYLRYRVDSDAQWEQYIRDEINAGRPVLYDGVGKNGGHLFVIDGYEGRYFSINYGWGEGSAFFTLSPVEGHEKDMTEFNTDHGMVCQIMPDQGGSPVMNVNAFGRPYLPSDFHVGEEFPLGSCNIWATSLVEYDDPYQGVFAYALYDKQGKFKETVSEEKTLTIPKGLRALTGIFFECKVTKALADGDMIAMSYKDPNTGQWTPAVQQRSTQIIFSAKPLSQQVEISYYDVLPDQWDELAQSIGRPINLRFAMYKDLCWTLYSDGMTNPVADSDVGMLESIDYVAGRVGSLTEEDLAESWLWLPAGHHRLVVRNPLSDETMTIHLEM